MTDAYRAFLASKIKLAQFDGFDVPADAIHPYLKPHAAAITRWALKGGRRAAFASFGLAKTSMQLEWSRHVAKHSGGPTLSVLPLGVRHGFKSEADKLDMDVRFIRSASEMTAGCSAYLTNYESVREGKIDPALFAGATLDEASVLRSYGSKTFQEFLPLFERVKFKLVATATPSPNRYKELIHYAGFLGIMDTGQALTRFFQRDSEKAGNLTLYPHMEAEFWLWVHSWAIFLQKPSDLGFSDEGYDLPPLEVNWHEVPSDHSTAGADRDGQGMMFRNAALGVSEAAGEKRQSLNSRIEKMTQLLAADPSAHAILWHDLESERKAIETAVPNVVSITGTGMGLEERELRLIDFEEGRVQYFATKPILSGSGSNFQYHCHWSIFTGIGFKFNDFIQAVHRTWRFGQRKPCRIDIIYSEAEREVRKSLEDKWQRDKDMRARMAEIIRRYGLNHAELHDTLKRSIGVNRVEERGDHFVAVNNDCVDEAARMADASVGQIVTSIPFGNHYEYSACYEDFGHSENNAHFWSQMDYLTPNLLRVLKPGRIACIHVKDRILFGNVTGAGAPTVSPFHAEAIFHYLRHGFDYMGMITIVTDVVRENNGTYRLGYSEMLKDSTKMGVGSPEYLLVFRRPQSDRSKGYADERVTKDPADYSLSRWQVDAHAFWRSAGDRLVTIDELQQLGPEALPSAFAQFSAQAPLDHETHVAIGEALAEKDRLPKTYMALAPSSHSPDVWHDVARMRTLNSEQYVRNVEKHVCPLQFDIVDRCIRRWSNKGDVIFDPFGGLMTVGYRAIALERRSYAVELSTKYFLDGVRYLREAEAKRAVPTLFDLIAVEDKQAAA